MYSDPKDPVFLGEELIEIIKKLIGNARSVNMPVIYVQHNGTNGSPLEKGTKGWNIRPEIAPQKSDIVIQKSTPNSFQNTELKARLEELGIQNLIICGIQSELCVDTTCRQAAALGYGVTLVKDGHSTFNTEILPAKKIIAHHNNVLQGWFVNVKKSDKIFS